MTDLTYRDVIDILRLIDTAAFADLEVEYGGTRLRVTRATAGAAPARDAAPVAPARETLPRPAAPIAPAAPARPAPTASSEAPGDGEVAVLPPMEGTFYAAPAPGQPPFAEVGRRIRRGDRLGIVEVMKLFTPVTAPCDGTVVKILVSNEQVVAEDQPLMILAVDGDIPA